MAQTVNEAIFDEALRRKVRIEQFSNGAIRRMASLLKKVEDDIVSQIAGLNGLIDADSFRAERLDNLLAGVRRQLAVFEGEVRLSIESETAALAENEIHSTIGGLQRAIPIEVDFITPAARQVHAAALAQPFRGKLLREWTEGLSQSQMDRVRSAVRIGFVEGEGIDRIVRRIRGTRRQGFRDGVLMSGRREVETVVRTAINHTANFARERTFEDNERIVGKVQYVATLDSRTTMICASLDGNVYNLGEGPRPPQHMNCRSTTIPITKSWRELGIDRDELDEGTRASMNGQVPAKTTYGDWLRRQPVSVQDEVLGPTRAKLFRSGGLDVSKFTNRRGKTLTIEELRVQEAATWDKVFGANTLPKQAVRAASGQ